MGSNCSVDQYIQYWRWGGKWDRWRVCGFFGLGYGGGECVHRVHFVSVRLAVHGWRGMICASKQLRPFFRRVMVALNEQFHHNDMPSRLQVTGAGRVFRSWELGVRRLWKRCAAECEMPDAGNSGSEYLWISALITDHGSRI